MSPRSLRSSPRNSKSISQNSPRNRNRRWPNSTSKFFRSRPRPTKCCTPLLSSTRRPCRGRSTCSPKTRSTSSKRKRKSSNSTNRSRRSPGSTKKKYPNWKEPSKTMSRKLIRCRDPVSYEHSSKTKDSRPRSRNSVATSRLSKRA